MGAPLALLLVVFLVYPVGQLLLLSFYKDERFQSCALSPALCLVRLRRRAADHAEDLAAHDAASVVAGYPIAYLVSMVGKERKATLLFWVLLSFWTSFLVRAFAWVVLLGRNGVVNQLLLSLGIVDRPASLLYSLAACLLAWCTHCSRSRC